MYKLLLLVVLLLIGCGSQYNQYHNIERAFISGCRTSTIESSLVNEGDKLIFSATCTKDK